MKIKQKIILIVSITALIIAGLFVLRAYYGDRFGIFADLLTDEKIIASKRVANGDFDNDQISNLTRVGDTLQIQNQGSQMCGNYPETADISGLPSDLSFNLRLLSIYPTDPYVVTNFRNNYYVGNKHYSSYSGTFPLRPDGDETNVDNPGFSITRGPGWIKVKLDAPTNPGPCIRNAVYGSISFPAGITLPANPFYTLFGADGPEAFNNNSQDLSSVNDEITIESAGVGTGSGESGESGGGSVRFFLANSASKDTFVINYCSDAVESGQSNLEGSVSGQIDLGESKPISKMQLVTRDYLDSRDEVLITTEISNDGIDWIEGPEISGLKYDFQGTAPKDTYCFRYIKYQIKLKTTAPDPASAVKLVGFDIYGGDTCGTDSSGLDPGGVNNLGTACSNGIDDDGDGLIDYPNDPGCTNFMDDDETNAAKICRGTANDQIQLTVNIDHHFISGVESDKNIYLGLDKKPLTSPATIRLVSDGIAVRDSGFQDRVSGLSVYRGEGYFFLYNQSDNLEGIKGNFELTGSKITKVINYFFENPTDGWEVVNDPESDEYAIEIAGNTGTFTTSTSRGDVDGVYIFYQYAPKIAGGCQCQDGIDNDNDGFIDYPDDFDCSSLLDNEEGSLQPLPSLPVCQNGLDDDGDGKIDYPDDPGCYSADDDDETDEANKADTTTGSVNKSSGILPSLISSGPAFWVLILVILLISGGSIYLIIKKDKNKTGK